jgi:hypothetical protein
VEVAAARRIGRMAQAARSSGTLDAAARLADVVMQVAGNPRRSHAAAG